MILTLGTTPALQRTMTFSKLALDSVNRAQTVRETASGKSINVARVIHAVGERCLATGFLGGDRGAACRRDLDSLGIQHDFTEVGSTTRMCTTLLDRNAGSATELIEEAGDVTAADADNLLEKLETLLASAKVLVVSGTLAPGCGDDFYAQCLQLANRHNVRAILDAKGPPLSLALTQRPFVVKPNRSELAATVNRSINSDADLREAVRGRANGARWALVTNGAGPTVVSDGKTLWQLRTPAVKVVNPIGSGDSFAAGIAIGIARGESVPEASRLGVACGAANAMTEFAGHVRREDVERLRGAVSLESPS